MVPISLMVVNECLQVAFDFSVHSFGLTISLGVVRHAQVSFNSDQSEEFLHECHDKLGAAVADNLER